MKFYNINDAESFVIGKIEYDNIQKENAKKENKEYNKLELSDFARALQLDNNIFTHQNIDGMINVIPYTIIKDNDDNEICYYVNSENIEKEFKAYINNIENITLKKVKEIDMLNIDLRQKSYLIKDKQLYIFE